MKVLAVFLVFVAELLMLAPAMADPHPIGLRNHKFNGPSQPVTKNGITTFHIENHGCSNVKYGDGRGESDCFNGNVRSAIGGGRDARMGDTFEYRFDIKVGEGFNYQGWYDDNSLKYLPDGWNSRLRIASWEGEHLHNFLYMLKLDARRGIVFLGQTCVPPAEIFGWHSFSLKVRWASDKSGWIRVTCDDRTIWLEDSIATNQAPHCYITNQCEEGIRKNPRRVFYLLGPVLAGFGHEWKKHRQPSQYTEIGPEGITISMRNIAINRGNVSLYSDEDRQQARELQAHLNALGCDVGKPDGVIGPRSRAAAKDCRSFDPEEWPSDTELSLRNVGKILALYKQRYPLPN